MQEQIPNEVGYLIVRVSTASGALPLRGATVIVRGNTPETSGVLRTLTSDRDGLTERIALAAPPASNSSAPGIAQPFTTYNITVSMPGYAENTYQNVPIFAGITAMQPAELLPLASGPIGYRDEDTRFFESENPQL